jgi:hypothetical protein
MGCHQPKVGRLGGLNKKAGSNPPCLYEFLSPKPGNLQQAQFLCPRYCLRAAMNTQLAK